MPSLQRPSISILTITRNNLVGLKKTIASVASQSMHPFEFIVHDGLSEDGTQDHLAACPHVSRWDSAKDGGIADAFNKIAEQAQGDWLLFLNAGDTLVDDQVLADAFPRLAALPANVGVCVGDAFLVDSDGSPLGIQSGKLLSGNARNTICHQATFIRRDLQRANPYDHRLRIGMDYDLWHRLGAQASFSKVDRIICTYQIGGISSSKAWAEHSIISHHLVDWLNLKERKLGLGDAFRLIRELLAYRMKKIVERVSGQHLYNLLRRMRFHA